MNVIDQVTGGIVRVPAFTSCSIADLERSFTRVYRSSYHLRVYDGGLKFLLCGEGNSKYGDVVIIGRDGAPFPDGQSVVIDGYVVCDAVWGTREAPRSLRERGELHPSIIQRVRQLGDALGEEIEQRRLNC